jgi:hypothetical protein
MTDRAWQTTEYKVVTSSITGRRIIVNSSDDCFLIPGSFDSGKARHVADEFRSYCNGLRSAYAPSSRMLPFLSAFDSISCKIDLGESINALIKRALPLRIGRDKARITDLLLAFWGAGCLLWPRRNAAILGNFKFGSSKWVLRAYKIAGSSRCEWRGHGCHSPPERQDSVA